MALCGTRLRCVRQGLLGRHACHVRGVGGSVHPRDSLSMRAFMAVRWAFVQLRHFLPPTITSLVPANVLLRTYNSGSITDIV
jgi:hypothetical protein